MGGNSGGREASGVDPDPHGVEWEERGREASGVEENPGRGRQGVGGGRGLNLLRKTRPATERARGSNRPRKTQPPTEGEGELSHGRMSRLQKKTEGESSRHGKTRPPEKMGDPGETKPLETPQRPDPERGRMDGGRG